MPRRTILVLALLSTLAAASVALRLLVGGSRIDGVILGWPADPAIVELRALAALAAALVGASLGVAGAQLQALLRNPLASPDLLGMSSGAGFAVVFASLLAGGVWVAPAIPATVGAVGTLAIVYLAAQRRGMLEPVSLVLIGVIVSVMLAAATVAAQSLMPRETVFSTSRWMLGAIGSDIRWWEIGACGGVLATALGLSLWHGPRVDGAAFSDDEAHALGVPLRPLRVGLFLVSGVMTAACVVLAGPVGFVGLVCPHVVRLLIGPTHRGVAVGAALAGAAMLVLADVLVEAIPVKTGRLPIGVLTAVVGGPVFLVLLRREMRAGA
jgi:iron complex transport system permease protein